MKRVNIVLLSAGVAGLILLLAALPLGVVGAQGSGTPAPFSGGLGDLIIPTATPGGSGGFTIPTATPSGSGGGFMIPTSTPATGAQSLGPEFPTLSDEQLTDLNMRPGDVPAAFAANRTVETFVSADTVAQIAEYSQDLADDFETLAAIYGWDKSIGVTYAACQPDLPINEIYSEAIQLPSADMARAFFDDPEAEDVFASLGYTIEPATSVHGWLLTVGPFEGTCFPQETTYSLNFDYWGLMLSVSMTANADTDPALVTSLLDQLAPVLIAHADALATSPFPATPVPGAAQPITVPPTWTPIAPVSTAPTLSEIERLMPSAEEMGLSSADYTLNTDLSLAYSTQQWVALLEEYGLSELANALAQNAAQNGMIGQVSRVWDTGTTCPPDMAISLEIDVTLFETTAGAQAFLADRAYLQALGNLGQNLEQSGGALVSSMATSTQCGNMMTYAKTIPAGRFLVASSVIVYQDIRRDEVLPILDMVNQFMIDKLTQAGL